MNTEQILKLCATQAPGTFSRYVKSITPTYGWSYSTERMVSYVEIYEATQNKKILKEINKEIKSFLWNINETKERQDMIFKSLSTKKETERYIFPNNQIQNVKGI